MSTMPTMALSPNAIPWGRSIASDAADNSIMLERVREEVQNSERILNSRMDLLRDQVEAIGGIAEISTFTIPEFTGIPNQPDDGNIPTKHIISPNYFMLATRGSSRGMVFLNLRIDWVSGGGIEKLANPTVKMGMQVGQGRISGAVNSQPGLTLDPNTFYTWAAQDVVNTGNEAGTNGYTVSFSVSGPSASSSALEMRFNGTITLLEVKDAFIDVS